MTFWCVRAGQYGENEAYALENGVMTIGWEDLKDISKCKDRGKLDELMVDTYPDCKRTTTRIWTGEVWAFKDTIQQNDLVALPLKSRSAIAFGHVQGPYRFDPNAPFDAKHQRAVKCEVCRISRSSCAPRRARRRRTSGAARTPPRRALLALSDAVRRF